MTLEVDCGKVNPASGCGHVIRAESEEELMQKVERHAREDHGMEPTPELVQQVRAQIVRR